MTQIELPSGESLDFAYDSGGRLNALTLPAGTIHYTYNLAGQVSQVSDVQNGTLVYDYDGFLPVVETYTGAFMESVQHIYDNNFWLKEVRVNGQNGISYSYDPDGLLTKAGSLTLNRNVQTGFLSNMVLGTINTLYSYNTYGELSDARSTAGGLNVSNSILITMCWDGLQKRSKLSMAW